jgi:hypothetical protein
MLVFQPEPIRIPTIVNHHSSSIEKRGRKKKKAQIPITPRIKIRFGGKSAEELDADEANESKQLNDSLPSTSAAAQSTSSHRKKSNKKKSSSKIPTEPKSTFSWYTNLPSIEELESRTPLSLELEREQSPTDPMTLKFRDRKIVLMPYLESGLPDFLLYDYPDKDRYILKRRR